MSSDDDEDEYDYAESDTYRWNIAKPSTSLSREEENEERQKILLEASTTQDSPDKSKTFNADLIALVKEVLSKGRSASHRIFHNDLIDTLPSVVENEPIFRAGSLLDAGARIYSFKVDATYSEVHEFRSRLCCVEDIHSDSIAKRSESTAKDGEQNNQDIGQKKNGRIQQSVANDDDEEQSDMKFDQVGTSTVYLEDYHVKQFEKERVIQFGEQLTESEIIETFCKNADRFRDQNAQRRAKVINLASNYKELDRLEASPTLYSHAYYKAIRRFDEGSVNGLLMHNALMSEDGKHYLLHNLRRNSSELRVRTVDGSALTMLFGVMEESERAHLESRQNANTSTNTSNTSELCSSQEVPIFDVNRNDRNFASDAKDAAESLIDDLSAERACDFVFQWRRDLQKRHAMTSRQCVKYLIDCICELRPFLLRDIARKLLLPPGRQKIDTSHIHIAKGFPSAILAKQVTPFEESMDWILHQKRSSVEKITGEESSESVLSKDISEQKSEYKYFFAHPRTDFWVYRDSCSIVNPNFWKSMCVLDSDKTSLDASSFADALQNFTLRRNGGIFSQKGRAFYDVVSRVNIVTPSNSACGWERVRDNSVRFNDVSIPLDPLDEEICSNMSHIRNLSDIDQNSDVERDFFVSADSSAKNLPEEKSNHVLQFVDNITQIDDLNYGKKTEICKVNASIIQDDTHWKQDRKKDDECAVKKRRAVAKQAEEKHKVISSAAEWDWVEYDDVPLDIIRKQLLKTKRIRGLLLSDSSLLAPASSNEKFSLEYDQQRFKNVDHYISKNCDGISESNVLENRKHSDYLPDVEVDVNNMERLFDMHLDSFINHTGPSLAVGESEHVESIENHCSTDLERNSRSSQVDDIMEGRESPGCSSSSDSSIDESFGGNLIVRRGCIDPFPVKRAIGVIMCDSELDAISLNKEIATARALNLIGDEVSEVDILEHNFESRSNASDLESISDQATASGSSTIHDTYGTNATLKNFKLRGHHTFSSILRHLPSRLANSNPEYLNPITAFSVLLHICNDNNLLLIQKCGVGDGAIASHLDDFSIIPVEGKQRNRRKRYHSPP